MNKPIRDAPKQRRRGRNSIITSPIVPHHPMGIEDDYARVVNAYVLPLKETVDLYLPDLKVAMLNEHPDASHGEAGNTATVTGVFDSIRKDMENLTMAYGLYSLVSKIGEQSHSFSYRQWSRIIQNALGVDLMKDYYMGGIYQQAVQVWVAQNVALIQSIPFETLDKMQSIIFDGFSNRLTISAIAQQIEEAYGVSRSRAEFLARDQIGNLHAQITRMQHQDAGCDEYIWLTKRDRGVRPDHADLHGMVCRWDDPPIVDTRTGRRCHPKEDYQCRCEAGFRVKRAKVRIVGAAA